MTRQDKIIDWWLHDCVFGPMLPRPVPGPLAVVVTPVKAKPVPVPVKSEWEDMPPIKIQDEKGNVSFRYLEKREVEDGTEFRPKDRPLSSVTVDHNLTKVDISELTKRKVGIETGQAAKLIFAVNPDISAGDLAKEIKKSMRTCENALAAFRVGVSENDTANYRK